MAQVTQRGVSVQTSGDLPTIGSQAPEFHLTATNLTDVTLAEFRGKKVVLNIFPSIDTGICAMSVRRFNAEIANYPNSVVLCISRDLPFAHKRFCGAEGLEHVQSLSELRTRDFGAAYGLHLLGGSMAGLLARAVLVLDEAGVVRYVELVPEIVQEPDYGAALAALA